MPTGNKTTSVALASRTAAAVTTMPTALSSTKGHMNRRGPKRSAKAPKRHRVTAALAVNMVSPSVAAAGEVLICGTKVISAPAAKVTANNSTIGGAKPRSTYRRRADREEAASAE